MELNTDLTTSNAVDALNDSLDTVAKGFAREPSVAEEFFFMVVHCTTAARDLFGEHSVRTTLALKGSLAHARVE
jgi:hypothetical protein